MTLGIASAVEPEPREDVDQEARRHDRRADAAQHGARQPRSAQVIGRFAAVVVEEHRLAAARAPTSHAGSGASRNEVYDAEKTWTTSARRSSRHSSGQ